MFEVREPRSTIDDPRPRPPTPADQDGSDPRDEDIDPKAETTKRHAALMDSLEDEGDRQSEERFQMSIDEDMQDHLQWRPEDAAALEARGQAPLVFNEGAQSVQWISGSEKRMRKDFKVLPRERGDDAGAEMKTHVLKYIDDVNMTPYHHSAAFKQAVIAGLSWLEDGINPDPEGEMIYTGKEDWRNVLRDSRGRDIIQRDSRYLFRKKRLDIDYATAMFKTVAPDRIQFLKPAAYRQEENAGDDGPWYLGEKLTGASDIGGSLRRASSFDERSAFMQSNGYFDSGRRMSVDIIECWYRVPDAVEVFVGGQFDGTVFDPRDQRHAAVKAQTGQQMRSAVKMRMRVMLCTADAWLWDGASPFKHNQFSLTPIFAYRRARDGMAYGVWRGMRDLSDDTNKRRSKALWALSANRVIIEKDALPEGTDIEDVRTEAAQPDMMLVVESGAINKVRFEKDTADIQGNLAMAQMNIEAIRNAAGVTGENLGQKTNASSGKAILAKQDQGSMATMDLFDNYFLAKRQSGKIRLSLTEQFMTQEKTVRVTGDGRAPEWHTINEYDQTTGQFKNDITAREADFVIDFADWNASLAQTALDQMFGLLGQIATFAPEVVLSVLDLVVESSNIKGKAQWIDRIRKINGQRDDSRAPTPEEQQAEAQQQAKQAKAEAMMEMAQEVEIALKQSKSDDLDAAATLKMVDAVVKRMNVMKVGVDAGLQLVQTPQVADVADELSTAAGLQDVGGPSTMAPGIAAAAPPPQEAFPPPVDPGEAVMDFNQPAPPPEGQPL